MDMGDMISSGIELMMIGMGIVFAFLTLLIVLVNVMTSLVEKYIPEDSDLYTSVTSAITRHTDAGIIAAISAAVHQYRTKHKQ
jgi:oxaloacetate decarboxylase gamma subunit